MQIIYEYLNKDAGNVFPGAQLRALAADKTGKAGDQGRRHPVDSFRRLQEGIYNIIIEKKTAGL